MKKKAILVILLVLVLSLSTSICSFKLASAATPFFFDDFTGTQVDTGKWFVQENTDWSEYPANGGSVTVADSQISLSSSGSSFPYLKSIVNPFPATGDFVLEFNITYTCISDWGNGIWVSKGPYEFAPGSETDNSSNRVIFYLWADNYSFDECWIHASMLGGDYVYTSVLHGWEPSAPAHIFRLAYANETYSLSVDGKSMASKPSQLRPDTIGLGHQPSYWIPFSPEHARSVVGAWGSYSMDYIKVEALDSSGNDNSNDDSGALQISLSTSVETQQIGYKIDINGKLESLAGEPVFGKQIVLWYSIPGVSTWYPITSVTTDSEGIFSASWIPTATGTFSIKAEHVDNQTHVEISKIKNISVIQLLSEGFFVAESNSTLSAIAFNSTANEFSFSVSGPSGTTGYTTLLLPKSILPNPENTKLYIDNQQTPFNNASKDNSWVLSFNYTHSTHAVVIKIVDENNTLIVCIAAVSVIIFCALLALAITQTFRSINHNNPRQQ